MWSLGSEITINKIYNARCLRRIDEQLRPGFPYEFEVGHKTKIIDPKIYILTDEKTGKCREIQIVNLKSNY